MKKVLRFPNPEVEAEVLSPAPASKTRYCAIVTNWLLCCAAGGGGLHAGSAGEDAGTPSCRPCCPAGRWGSPSLPADVGSGGVCPRIPPWGSSGPVQMSPAAEAAAAASHERPCRTAAPSWAESYHLRAESVNHAILKFCWQLCCMQVLSANNRAAFNQVQLVIMKLLYLKLLSAARAVSPLTHPSTQPSRPHISPGDHCLMPESTINPSSSHLTCS